INPPGWFSDKYTSDCLRRHLTIQGAHATLNSGSCLADFFLPVVHIKRKVNHLPRGCGFRFHRFTALFVWMSRFVATAFPLTLSLSRKGRGNPRTASSYKCKPLYKLYEGRWGWGYGTGGVDD